MLKFFILPVLLENSNIMSAGSAEATPGPNKASKWRATFSGAFSGSGFKW
jgi:hypothetical protein